MGVVFVCMLSGLFIVLFKIFFGYFKVLGFFGGVSGGGGGRCYIECTKCNGVFHI